jgi:upstream activation factor subunit UAF30
LCGEARADSNELHPDGILTVFRLVRADVFPAVPAGFPSGKSVDKGIFPRHSLVTVQYTEKQTNLNSLLIFSHLTGDPSMAAKKKATKKAATKKPAAKKKKVAAKRKPNAAFMKPMQPSAALGAVIGSSAQPRTEVTKKIWAYIKKHDLQDSKNRNINADEKLKEVFGGKKQVSMFEMTKLVNKHLK